MWLTAGHPPHLGPIGLGLKNPFRTFGREEPFSTLFIVPLPNNPGFNFLERASDDSIIISYPDPRLPFPNRYIKAVVGAVWEVLHLQCQ